MVPLPTKRDIIAFGTGALVSKYPGMTARAAKKVASKAWRIGGWQSVVALYAIETNPQRPRDIPGPINVGFTPLERRIGETVYDVAAPVVGTVIGHHVGDQQIVPTVKDFRDWARKPLIPMVKRKVSKANKAVKQGMKFLKSGTKAQTGSAPGTLPAGAFKIATIAAGLANPKTKSTIGKGKSAIKKLARKLRSWW
jgi:hypothetical protein